MDSTDSGHAGAWENRHLPEAEEDHGISATNYYDMEGEDYEDSIPGLLVLKQAPGTRNNERAASGRQQVAVVVV